MGTIGPGTYTTTRFTPPITYSVPAGWSNFVDAGGEFLLLPPNGKLSGVNDGTSDYIGVYAEVAAPDGCDFLLAHGFSTSTADIMRWLRRILGS